MQPMSVENGRYWTETLSELELQMAKATYNSWLRDARPVAITDDKWIIGVRSATAKEWIEHSLARTIHRTLSSIVGRPLEITYEVYNTTPTPTAPEPPDSPPEPPQEAQDTPAEVVAMETATDPTPPYFAGFTGLASNWTRTPNLFYTAVLRHESHAVVRLVGAIIKNTLGTFINMNGDTRKRWEVSIRDIGRESGIKSLESVVIAIWDARARGYIIREEVEGERIYAYRIRHQTDDLDRPSEPRPGIRRKVIPTCE